MYGVKTILENAKLSVGDTIGNSSPSGSDVVIAQSIPAGSFVAEGCAVSLTFERKSSNELANTEQGNQNNSSENNQEQTNQSSDSKQDNGSIDDNTQSEVTQDE